MMINHAKVSTLELGDQNRLKHTNTHTVVANGIQPIIFGSVIECATTPQSCSTPWANNDNKLIIIVGKV